MSLNKTLILLTKVCILTIFLNACSNSKLKWGYIDQNGNIQIEAKFDCAKPFHDGYAAINFGCNDDSSKRDAGGKWGFINTEGAIEIPATFEEAGSFSENLAWVRSKTDVFFINSQGKRVSTDSYWHALDYSDGRAVIELENGTRHIIDLAGKKITQQTYAFAKNCSEGLCFALSSIGGSYEISDINGVTQVHTKFDYAEPFSEGLAAVGKSNYYGFINHRGHTVIPVGLINVHSFSEGLAPAKFNSSEGWVFINKKGEIVIKCKLESACIFSEASRFSEGLASVQIGELWGYINRKGEFIQKPQFTMAKDFSQGLAAVEVDSLWGYIDRTGKIVIPPKFLDVDRFSNGLARIQVEVKP
jgi:hypothetical protein